MLHQGLPPDVIAYNTLISACEKDTLPQRALQPLEAMLHQGLQPDVTTYLRWSMTAESVRCRRGPCSSWMQWRTEASCPTGSPTSSMIRACEKGTLPRRVHELFKTMLHQGLNPDVITYNALIGACERGTLPQRALQLLEAMLHQGLLPDVVTYNALISACEKGTLPQRATQL